MFEASEWKLIFFEPTNQRLSLHTAEHHYNRRCIPSSGLHLDCPDLVIPAVRNPTRIQCESLQQEHRSRA